MRRRRSARKRKIVLDAALGLVAGAALTSHPILFPVRVKAKPSLCMQWCLVFSWAKVLEKSWQRKLLAS